MPTSGLEHYHRCPPRSAISAGLSAGRRREGPSETDHGGDDGVRASGWIVANESVYCACLYFDSTWGVSHPAEAGTGDESGVVAPPGHPAGPDRGDVPSVTREAFRSINQ